ncbi:tubulin-specific chaperone C [Nemania sp. FL0916]|nr:tubulin-specific chaperone C [Nemania sp. FL0916]
MEDPKEKFFRHFQAQVGLIRDEIDSLASLSAVGSERKPAIDKVLAGISRLSNEVMDATDYIPGYDQRTYSQAIKALTDKLNAATEKARPKSRFQFKARNTGVAGAQASAAAPDSRIRRHWDSDGGQDTANPGSSVPGAETRDAVVTLPPSSNSKNYNEELARSNDVKGVRKPSFSSAKNISISGHSGLHIILPSSASCATSSGSLTDLSHCIVDMTIPTLTTSGAPFAGLALKNIDHSLVIAGNVAGPVHITNVRDSIVVVAARQVRVHECVNVRLYLHCASHPIIEDCEGMAFAPLPGYYMNESTAPEANQWDQVDDFKWLKDVASPNWSILAEERRVKDEVWRDTVCGKPGMNTDDILRELGIVTDSGRAFDLAGEGVVPSVERPV